MRNAAARLSGETKKDNCTDDDRKKVRCDEDRAL
jgi:hypothetical protein